MVFMIDKKYANKDLEIELTSFIDEKQNVWFKGKDIAKILGYVNPSKAIRDHVDPEDKYPRGSTLDPHCKYTWGQTKGRFNK